MIYYSGAFLLYYAFIFFGYQDIQKNKPFFLYCGILPLILLAFLRGNVGTDTNSYLNILSNIAATGNGGVERGFTWCVKLLLVITHNNMLILVLVALVTTVMLVISSRTDSRALFIFTFGIVPIFYFDFTMNMLRAGLASSFIMYSISQFYQRRLLFSAFLGVIAVLFHISAILLCLITALVAKDKNEFKRWLILISALLLAMLFFNDFSVGSGIDSGIDLKNKIQVYSVFKVKSWYSGLATLIISSAFLCIVKYQNTQAIKQRYFYVLFSFVIITFCIAKLSYAGVRLQSLALFGILLTMQFNPAFAWIMNNHAVKKRIAIVGCIGAMVCLKNISQSTGLSPFIPWVINPDLVKLWGYLNT